MLKAQSPSPTPSLAILRRNRRMRFKTGRSTSSRINWGRILRTSILTSSIWMMSLPSRHLRIYSRTRTSWRSRSWLPMALQIWKRLILLLTYTLHVTKCPEQRCISLFFYQVIFIIILSPFPLGPWGLSCGGPQALGSMGETLLRVLIVFSDFLVGTSNFI